MRFKDLPLLRRCFVRHHASDLQVGDVFVQPGTYHLVRVALIEEYDDDISFDVQEASHWTRLGWAVLVSSIFWTPVVALGLTLYNMSQGI